MTIHNYSRAYYSHFIFSELLKHLCLPGKLNDWLRLPNLKRLLPLKIQKIKPGRSWYWGCSYIVLTLLTWRTASPVSWIVWLQTKEVDRQTPKKEKTTFTGMQPPSTEEFKLKNNSHKQSRTKSKGRQPHTKDNFLWGKKRSGRWSSTLIT